MIELVLRTTESSGLVKEQILARLDGGQALPEADSVLEYSGLCIDSLRQQVSYQGQGISLTENYEFRTLAYLASQPGRVFTKEQIYQAVWKEEPVDVSSAVFCIIGNIRQKLRKRGVSPLGCFYKYVLSLSGGCGRIINAIVFRFVRA